MLKLTEQSRITFYSLSIQKDKKNYIVEEPISGDFYEMPKICIDAIEQLNQGETVGAVEKVLKNKYPNEKVDMIEFAGQLVDLGLVQEVDGVPVNKDKVKQKSNSTAGFAWIPSKVGRFFFNRVSNKVYLLMLIVNILFVILNPAFFPRYQDIFLFDSMMFNVITYMLISLVLIFIHEMGHVIAIRAYDLPAKLSIGNRLVFIVFETDLTQAWKLQPKERNVLYFGGMAFEQVLLFIAFGLMTLFPSSEMLVGMLGIVVFDIFIKTLYQCCFYMKTDVYYVLENVTGCYNLMESGIQYIREKFRKQSARRVAELFSEELGVVRLYSVFYVCGVLLTFILLFVYFIPQLYYAYATVISNMLHPEGNMAYWDAIFFLVQTMLMIGLLVYVVVKQRKAERVGS